MKRSGHSARLRGSRSRRRRWRSTGCASGCAGWGGGGRRRRREQHQRADGQQPADGRPAAAHRGQLHQGDRHQGQLHGAAGERRPRQDQPGVLQPGRPVRRRLAEQLRDPDLRAAATGSPRWTTTSRPTPAFDQADILAPMTESLTGDDGKIYGEPFYGESSFLMYRKDVLDGQGHHDAGASPTWQQVADIAAQVDGAQPGHGRHLPARPARLGPGLRPADHGGQHLRRHLVQRGLDRPRSTRRSSRRPPSSTSTWSATHGENGAPQAGFTECLNNLIQGNVAMWYDATSRRRLARGRRLAGQGQDRLRRRAGRQDRELRLAVRLVVGHPAGQQEEGQRLEVHLLGVQQGVRGAGRRAARLVAGAGRQARLDLREPGVPRGGRRRSPSRPRQAIESADPRNPGVQPRPGDRHPVRRHPRVPRPRHPGLAGRQLGDRRADDASTRRWTRASSWPTTSRERYQQSTRATVRPAAQRRPLSRRRQPRRPA